VRLVFRADASPIIGAGHVMRLSAIAEEAIQQGLDCVFVGEIAEVSWLTDRILALGFSQISSPIHFRANPESDILILDSYHLSTNDFSIQRSSFRYSLLIADELTPSFVADLVVHPGLDGDWYNGDRNSFHYGAQFIPIRKSIKFTDAKLNREVRKILVFGGGTDAFNIAGELAVLLTKLEKVQKVTFFTSNTGSEIESIDNRFVVKPFGSDLDSEVDQADLVLTTASTSSFEIIARAKPLGVICAISNQRNTFDAIGNMGIAGKIGTRTESSEWKFDLGILERLVYDFEYRSLLQKKSQNIIDRLGASRILNLITDFES
jgi:spore coat polysaccharide biosynthesis predicted glycosyltransferase SpsG